MLKSQSYIEWTRRLGLVMAVLAIAACANEAENDSKFYAFEGVNVVPMDEERVLSNQTVLVRDGLIESVQPAGGELPDSATRIDAEGQYLMPGMAEMHGHVPGADDGQYADDVLFLYIANGVTLVRGMAGHPTHIEMREQLAAGELDGPTLYTASPWVGGHNAGSEAETRASVNEFQELGYDLVKVGNPSAENYEYLADEANQLGLPFGGHIPPGVGLERALEVGQVSIDHLDRYVEFMVPDEVLEERGGGFFGSAVVDAVALDRLPEAVELTLEQGTWNVPTLSLVEHLASSESPEAMADWPEMQYLPQEVIDGWVDAKHDYQAREDFQPEAAQQLVEVRREILMALHEAGAPIAFGSDAPQFFNVPGFSMHHEAEMMVVAGMSPYEVLVTGTRRPAEYFDQEDEFGQVRTGQRADLILLDNNPLEDIANLREPAGVMVRGDWYSREDIDRRLEEIAQRQE